MSRKLPSLLFAVALAPLAAAAQPSPPAAPRPGGSPAAPVPPRPAPAPAPTAGARPPGGPTLPAPTVPAAPSAPEPPPPPSKSSQDPWAGRTDLIPPPTPAPPRAVELGAVELVKLSNGLEVVLVPRHELPVIDFALALKTGDLDDPDGKAGLAGITAALLTKGTATRGAEAIAATIERLGGELGASSGLETTDVSCGLLARDYRTCLDLVADVVIHPSFPESELSLVRDSAIGGVKQRLDNPAALAGEHASNQLFGDAHPHGRVVTEKTLAAIDRAAVVEFHARHYTPTRALLAVAGDFDPRALKGDLERALGGWKPVDAPARAAVAFAAPRARRVLLVDKPDATQSQIVLTAPGVAYGDPDHLAVELMNYTLGGGGFSSRLMKVIRSEKGKTYNIHSSFEQLDERGAFTISTFTRTAETARTIRDVLDEVARYRAEGPTEDELTQSKGNVTGRYPTQLQSGRDVAGRVLGALLKGRDLDWVRSYAQRLAAVPRADVVRAAREHLDPEHVVVVIVGDARAIEPQLSAAKLGYEKVSFTDPISAREREERARDRAARARQAAGVGSGFTVALVEMTLRAHGGEAALRKVKDLSLKVDQTIRAGKQEMAAEATLRVLLPGNVRIDVSSPMGSQKLVVNPRRAYAQSGEVNEDLPARMGDELRKSAVDAVPGLLLLDIIDRKLLLEGSRATASDGKKVDVLSVTGDDGKTRQLAFDARTHLLQRIVDEDGDRVELSDYRPVGGIPVPHLVTGHSPKGDEIQKVTEAHINTGLDPALFK